MQKGRFDEAHNVLKRIHARKGLTSNEQAEKEYYQMRRQFEEDREVQEGVVWYEIFRTGPNRRRAMIAAILTWGNQFTGTLILANYNVVLFMNLGLKGYMPLLLLGIWVTIGLLGNIFTALYIDRWDRRKFLLAGVAGVWASLIIECALQAEYVGPNNTAGLKAAVFFLYLFIVFWGCCMDATQFVYLVEIFPTHIRGHGTAWGIFGTGMASIIVLMGGPVALEKIGWKFFLVLIIPTTFYWFAIYFLLPETGKRSLEDISESFGEKVAVHYHGATKAEEQEYMDAMEGGTDQGHGVQLKNVGSRAEHLETRVLY